MLTPLEGVQQRVDLPSASTFGKMRRGGDVDTTGTSATIVSISQCLNIWKNASRW